MTPEREQAEARALACLDYLAALSGEGSHQEAHVAWHIVQIDVPDAAEQIRAYVAAAVERERELTRALAPFVDAVSFYTGDTDNSYSLRVKGADVRRAREAFAGGVSAAGRPPSVEALLDEDDFAVIREENQAGGGTAAVAEAGEPCWCCGWPAPVRGDGDPWEGRMDGYCYECSLTRCDTSYSTCGRELSGALTTATAKRSHQEVVPAAPEVLPEETR